MYRIVVGREHDRSLKMLLCFSGPRSVSLVGQLTIDDPQVDLKAGIVVREDKGAAEVVERGGVGAFTHLRKTVVHQPAAVVVRLIDIVEPQLFFGVASSIAPV